VIGVPRIESRSVRFGLGGDGRSEFGCVGATHENESGIAESRGDVIVTIGDEFRVLEKRRPRMMRVADTSSFEIFEKKRNTSEWAFGKRSACFGSSLFEALMDHRVDRRVECFDSGNRCIDEFKW
jgi:hypothetical protein